MTTLSEILENHGACGVYVLDHPVGLTSLERLAKQRELAFFVLDGGQVGSKEEYLDLAATVLDFPVYFGKNWDAFADFLTDMSWIDRVGFLIVYTECRQFADHSPDDFATAIDIFKEAADFWQKEGKTFLVLLHDTTRLEWGLPLITP